MQLEKDDDKLSTADTSDMEGESATWFWNESANESDSDKKETRKRMRLIKMNRTWT